MNDPASTLRGALARVGYDADRVRGLLGDADDGLDVAAQRALWRFRASGRDPLAIAARLLLLEQPVREIDARAALGDDGLAALRTLALVRGGRGRVTPIAQLSLHDGLVIAADRLPARGREHVGGPTNATRLLERCLLPRRFATALDLGTGSGALALRLAARADRVVASDRSAQALAFARLNARLAGVRNVRFVRSDRFVGLGRSRFDLIVGNLPFVLSPERRFTYRDAGGESFFASVVAGLRDRLAPGGWAQILGQWVADGDDATEDERIAQAILNAGCDALVWRFEVEPIDRHAARWSAGPGERPDDRRIARWVRHHERAGVRAIATGLWTLRRRARGRHAFVIEDVGAPAGPCGVAVAARFAAMRRDS